MSFLFNKLILNNEIKEKISKSIKNIQALCDWHRFDPSLTIDDIDTFFVKYGNIQRQRSIWEEVAKLSIDLWRDFDYYGQFTFESKYDSEEYKKLLEDLGCVYDRGRWRSTIRPSEEVVQRNVFMFFVYRFMENDKVFLDKCPFCDDNIIHGEEKCLLCGSSFKDILDHFKMIHKKPLNKNILNKMDVHNDDNVNGQNARLYVENKVKESMEDREKYRELNVDNDRRKLFGIKSGNVTKWKCGGCECLNEYKFINCDACGGMYIDGKWTCGGCKEENSCEYKYCVKCCVKNVNMKAKEIDLDVVVKNNEIHQDLKERANKNIVEVNIDKNYVNKWKCGGCECLNEYIFINCVACGGIYKEGKWTCGVCKYGNSCEYKCCDKCGVKNVNMEAKEINLDVVKNNEIYQDLKERANKNMVEVNIDKNYVHKWKCGGCECFNEYRFINCEVCGGMYKDGKWICEKCTLNNSCINDNCNGCGDINVNVKVIVKRDEPEITFKERLPENVINRVQNRDNEIKIGNNQWRCGKCELLQSFDFIGCYACGESREVNGSWKCATCTMINKCVNITCVACFNTSTDLRGRHCPRCKLNKLLINEKECVACTERLEPIKTLLLFPKPVKDKSKDYCQKCLLCIHSPRGRGDELKRLARGREESIWMCYKCFHLNRLTTSKCKCGETRYKSVYCKKCELYNDGLTKDCGQCHENLY